MKTLKLHTKKPKTSLQKVLQRFGLWGTERVKVCSSWRDINILQYCALKNLEDQPFEIEVDRVIAELAIYTRIPIARLKGLPTSVLVTQVMPAVAEIKNSYPKAGPNKKTKHRIKVLNQWYSIPESPLQIESIRWMMIERSVTSDKTLMREIEAGNFERLPFAMAVILERDGAEEYTNSGDALQERERVFRHASVEDGIAVLSFFLKLQKQYLKHSLKSSLNLN